MKKLLIIIGLFAAVQLNAQGLKLSGQTFTDPSTGFAISTLYSYPKYYYSSNDSMVSLVLNVSKTDTLAKANVPINTPANYSIPQLYFVFKSATGYPTSTTLYNYIKPVLQAAPYGFTVTTF
jgi:hypothetical protein